MAPAGSVGVFSWGVYRLRHLQTFIDADRIVFRPGPGQARELDAVAGWGHKPTASAAREYARRHGLPYLALEDGFLRSMGLGAAEPPLSIVVDDVGIYYDARQPSRLESLLAFEGPDDPLGDPGLLARARACRERIVEAELSKYNNAPATAPIELGSGPTVLVVDQTFDDASVEQGLASGRTFEDMLYTASKQHPTARLVVKMHPEVVTGRKRGYLLDRARASGATVLAKLVNPIALLKRVDHVYVCTSLLGFEALMAGVPVTCFGAPFYAGWGLTTDALAIARRNRQRTLDELVAAALIAYPRYVHPVSGARCEVEAVIEHLALQRRMQAENARTFFCFGFSRWKRPFVRRYLAAPEGRVRFVSRARAVPRHGRDPAPTLVVWGTRRARGTDELAERLGCAIWRMEDGFLRSVRLGSELTPPGSLVLDSRGIYYDPRAPSDLEHFLQNHQFSPEEVARAARLRQRIVESGVSKYNAAARRPTQVRPRPGQKVVFVPGQVEDDASVLLGSPHVRSNAELLAAVRRLRPDAYVVFKPHPDVVIGNRRGQLSTRASGLFDLQIDDAPLADCLALADEVHTMTSLVGFEALLRGIRVVTWGQPFYAGWGLTEDQHPVERRRRRLELDELVAGALIQYPRYYSFRARTFCTPEAFVDELVALRCQGSPWIQRAPWLLRRLHSLGTSAREWLAG